MSGPHKLHRIYEVGKPGHDPNGAHSPRVVKEVRVTLRRGVELDYLAHIISPHELLPHLRSHAISDGIFDSAGPI